VAEQTDAEMQWWRERRVGSSI